jgi:hypothetical protein
VSFGMYRALPAWAFRIGSDDGDGCDHYEARSLESRNCSFVSSGRASRFDQDAETFD